jgi:hypothetical protein
VFHRGTAFQYETPAGVASSDRARFILKRAFRRETANPARRAPTSSISARFAFGTAAALHERRQEDGEMKRTQAIAIGLVTVLMTTAARAARPDREEVQAPRGQEVQAPRGQHDVQEATSAAGGTTDELV